MSSLVLGDLDDAPGNIDYRDWFFYRSAMNPDEVSALAEGNMLKSSLEIYAPLDGQAVLGSNVFVNLAQSMNTVEQKIEDNWTGNDELIASIEEGLSIYPSPAYEFINIELDDPGNSIHYTIMNLLGENLKQGTIEGSLTRVNISGLPSGFYVLKSKKQAFKFIKH